MNTLDLIAECKELRRQRDELAALSKLIRCDYQRNDDFDAGAREACDCFEQATIKILGEVETV